MDAKDKEIRDLRAALLEARTTAYILVHAYVHDTRPPASHVIKASKYKELLDA